MEDQSQLEKLLTALENSCVDDGFQILTKILELQGDPAPPELQNTYIEGLLGLLKREPSLERVQKVSERLRETPLYQNEPARVLSHAEAIISTVPNLADYTDRVKAAESIADFKGYGASFELQIAHSQALFEVSQHGDAKALDIAQRIRQIPSFRDSEEIQIACAKTCRTAGKRAASLDETQSILELLRSLPQVENQEEIGACLEKVEKKHAKFLEQGAKLKKANPFKPALVGASILLVGVTAAFSYSRLMHGGEPTETTSSVAFLSDEEEYQKYSAKGQEAAAKGDFDEATTYGAMALRRAKVMGNATTLADALDFLGTSYLRLNNHKRAETYFGQVPPSQLQRLGEVHLSQADEALASGKVKLLRHEVTTLVKIYKLNSQNLKRTELEQAAKICEKGKLWSHASVMQVHLGDLAKAAEYSESAGETQRALELLQLLAKKDPKGKDKLAAFRTRSGEKTLLTAEKSLSKKELKEAEAQATSALDMLKGAAKANPLKSRAHTVRAKVAYLQEQYPEAVKAAKLAHDASPNPETKSRLTSYRTKDAQHVTRDELFVDSFIFPPAKKTDKTYTYTYFFGHPKNNATRGAEQIFQSPEHKIDCQGSYNKRSVSFTVNRDYRARRSSYEFILPNGELKPGTYRTNKGRRYNSPRIYFRHAYRSNSGKCRFVVHEAQFSKTGKIKKFAADFIQGDYAGNNAVYGKVRYNSSYE